MHHLPVENAMMEAVQPVKAAVSAEQARGN
jgi:hypothetical protein